MPDAAERALISVATAYRYFPSADDLWFEAAQAAVSFQPRLAETDAAHRGVRRRPGRRDSRCSSGPSGSSCSTTRSPIRRLAKAALEQWFSLAESPTLEPAPVREGRRNRQIALVVEPLRGQLPDGDVDRLAHALGLVVGTEAMIALTDGVGLDVADAKDTMLDAARWILTGALAEIQPPASDTSVVPRIG